MTLGYRERSRVRLKEAVLCFREALKERPRDRAPIDWAQAQNNLGSALSGLGEGVGGTKRLELAITAHHNALKEYTRETFPLRWAQVKSDLGRALLRLGEREGDTSLLKRAVAAYRDSLQELGDETNPQFDLSGFNRAKRLLRWQ